jgi:hypothetical protein
MSSKESVLLTSAQEVLESKSLLIQLPFHILRAFLSGLYLISQLLNTNLDKETLATCVGMIESGVNPEALAVRSTQMAPCWPFL